jgi:hypothetical protein
MTCSARRLIRFFLLCVTLSYRSTQLLHKTALSSWQDAGGITHQPAGLAFKDKEMDELLQRLSELEAPNRSAIDVFF